MLEDIIAFRRQLHACPELSGQEKNTHDALVRYLEKLHPTRLYTQVGGYGLIAVFGSENGLAVAFRADTDALPIQERTPLAYASTRKGVSHKCGHDGHAAVLLHLAEKISERLQNGEKLPYTVLLVFQAAEETGEGSARILSAGILQKYRILAFYGMHNLPGYPLGRLVFRQGTFAAASIGVVLHFQGRQTHAAFPELGVNPGLAVADTLKQVCALNTDPAWTDGRFRQATLICVRIGQEAFGTSAGEAELMFTLRAYTNAAMEKLKSEVVSKAESEAARHGLRLSVEWREAFHATENHTEAVDFLKCTAEKNGFPYEKAATPFRWSEDFADYLMNFSGAFFGMGSGENCPELHHPDYDFPDDIIERAASFMEKLLF